MAKDEWEEKFGEWKKRKSEREKVSEKPVQKNFVNEEVTPAKEPRHLGVLKFVIWLIPIVVLLYLVSANFITAHEFVYFYDIGSATDNYLTPVERISEAVDDGTENYRTLNDGLVYFDVPIARGADKVYIEARIKDNLPDGAKISLGARDQEEWHYIYNLLYDPDFDLNGFESKDGVYRINENLDVLGLAELKKTEGIIIASDGSFETQPVRVADYRASETVIDTTLRGQHVFYLYAKGNLEVEVLKQDINWYDGKDDLEFFLYDADGVLIKDARIGDDGIEGVDKEEARVQSGVLKAKNLKEGVYKLEFKDFDGLIREIRVNTNKIVAEKLFLAGNEIYGVEKKPSEVYFYSDGGRRVKFHTYHAAGIQDVGLEINGRKQTFDLDREDESLLMETSEGFYVMTFPENDVIIESSEYFAFSSENYFRPFKQKVIPIGGIEDVKANADYLITDYKTPEQDGDWVVVGTEFDISEDNLFVKDDKLSIVFNIPHLTKQETKNNVIPADWIKIKVYKSGVFS